MAINVSVQCNGGFLVPFFSETWFRGMNGGGSFRRV